MHQRTQAVFASTLALTLCACSSSHGRNPGVDEPATPAGHRDGVPLAMDWSQRLDLGLIAAITTDGDRHVLVSATRGIDVLSGNPPVPGDDLLASVAKLSQATGEVLWTAVFEHRDWEAGALAVDQEDNVFWAVHDFDSPLAYSITAGQPLGVIGVLKLSGQDGSVLWEVAEPAAGSIESIAVDGAGNAVVSGYTVAGAVAGATPLGNGDAFVMKLAGTNGEMVWGRTIGTAGVDTGRAVAASPAMDHAWIGDRTGNALSFVQMLSPDDGATVWESEGPTPDAPGQVLDNVAVGLTVVPDVGVLVAWDCAPLELLAAGDGERIWEAPGGSCNGLDDSRIAAGGELIAASARLDNRRGRLEGEISALGVEDGKPIWSRPYDIELPAAALLVSQTLQMHLDAYGAIVVGGYLSDPMTGASQSYVLMRLD